MKRPVLAASALVLAAGLAGCSVAPDHDQDLEPQGTIYGVPGGRGSVYKVDVDGTTCVIYTRSGISCDWNNEGAPSNE